MAKGTMKFFNESKGYGFVIDDESKKEIFVHSSGLKNKSVKLKENDKVMYTITDGKKGPNAVDVQKL